MTSILDVANCCSAVYDSVPSVSGLNMIRYYDHPRDGFFAALFKKGNKAVFAIRGTDDLRYDIPNDISIFAGRMPAQFKQASNALNLALDFADISTDHFYITGHSLGGGLAALLSAKHITPLPLITFNSPGMLRAATSSNFGVIGTLLNYSRLSGYRNKFKKAMHIRSEHDAVSKGTGSRITGKPRTLSNNQCGEVSVLTSFTVPALGLTQAGNRALCAHSMDGLVQLISVVPEFHQPINWG